MHSWQLKVSTIKHLVGGLEDRDKEISKITYKKNKEKIRKEKKKQEKKISGSI